MKDRRLCSIYALSHVSIGFYGPEVICVFSNIVRSVHQRLLQCPNSRLSAAAAANAAALEYHAAAAAALRPAAPRAPFERGWCAWSRGSYPAAALHFREALLTAAAADDDVFCCAASWALALTAAQGGCGGPTVPVSQIEVRLDYVHSVIAVVNRCSNTLACSVIRIGMHCSPDNFDGSLYIS